MNQKEIEYELEKWDDDNFLKKVNTELCEYVNELDKLLYERYCRRIESFEPDDKARAMKILKSKKLIDDDMSYVGKSNIVEFDRDIKVTNGGFIKNKIIVNPNSAKQFYASYIDFSNGKTEGIRKYDYSQPLDSLKDLSSLETLYWYYFNGRTYQEFLKSTMLHEDIHRWTLRADMLDDPIDIFTMEGLVETEAREVAKENNIEYAKCFRNDEIMLIDYFNKYNKIDKTNTMLCYTSEAYLKFSIAYAIKKEVKEISKEKLVPLAKEIYFDLIKNIRSDNNSSVGINYREVFAQIRPNKSYKIIELIENAIAKEKTNQILESKSTNTQTENEEQGR